VIKYSKPKDNKFIKSGDFFSLSREDKGMILEIEIEEVFVNYTLIPETGERHNLSQKN